jgi:hypothetical protein
MNVRFGDGNFRGNPSNHVTFFEMNLPATNHVGISLVLPVE